MSVAKDSTGRRTVQLDVELAATPDEVWQAIATGPGISSWFVPTEVEEREGGRIVFHLGPGMDSAGRVTGWEPPRRFAYEEREWAPGAPPVATELTIEARSGGTCIMRLVHSLFASGDEWDDQLESFEAGWPPFFEVLRLVLRHFPGQPCSTIRLTQATSATEAQAWDSVKRALGLTSAVEGARPAKAAAAAPPFDGIVHDARTREIVMRLEQPAPGVGLFAAYTWAERVNVSITLYLFGAGAASVAARDEAAWRAWLEQTVTAAPRQGVSP
jgi:uncharacterized protein YndB with AHSA1/START domain